jgi:acetyltransferase-like isoleucine patch superfamily enzyme
MSKSVERPTYLKSLKPQRPKSSIGWGILSRHARDFAIAVRIFILRRVYGMDIAEHCRVSLKANLDKTHPRGIHIGQGTYIAFGAVVLAHDMSRRLQTDTYIGSNCFIGANAIILPGVRVGDSCIVGAGSVVTKDVPNNCMVAGNPAALVRSGIRTTNQGILARESGQ